MPRRFPAWRLQKCLEAITEDSVQVHSLPADFATDVSSVAGESWETRSIMTTFSNLCESHRSNPRVPLDIMNDELQEMHEKSGIPWRKFRRVINDRGICLVNCFEYGNPAALAEVLHKNPMLIINRREAKIYHHVKACLIAL